MAFSGQRAADKAKPTETARYMNTKSGAVVAIVYFSIVPSRAVKATAVVKERVRRKGSGRRDGAQKGSRRTH